MEITIFFSFCLSVSSTLRETQMTFWECFFFFGFFFGLYFFAMLILQLTRCRCFDFAALLILLLGNKTGAKGKCNRQRCIPLGAYINTRIGYMLNSVYVGGLQLGFRRIAS